MSNIKKRYLGIKAGQDEEYQMLDTGLFKSFAEAVEVFSIWQDEPPDYVLEISIEKLPVKGN